MFVRCSFWLSHCECVIYVDIGYGDIFSSALAPFSFKLEESLYRFLHESTSQIGRRAQKKTVKHTHKCNSADEYLCIYWLIFGCQFDFLCLFLCLDVCVHIWRRRFIHEIVGWTKCVKADYMCVFVSAYISLSIKMCEMKTKRS